MQKNITAKKLKIFMRGKSVSALQTQLRQRGFSITDSAGVFGPSTRDAVKAFQTQMSLPVTGIVDEIFWQAFGGQQFTHAAEKGQPNKMRNKHETDPRMDALINLLVEKGIINQKEIDDRLNQALDDEPAAKPLFL